MSRVPYHMAKCRECGKLRKVSRREMTRAAPPRCYACGGMVELSNPGKDDYGDAFRTGKAVNGLHIGRMTGRIPEARLA